LRRSCRLKSLTFNYDQDAEVMVRGRTGAATRWSRYWGVPYSEPDSASIRLKNLTFNYDLLVAKQFLPAVPPAWINERRWLTSSTSRRPRTPCRPPRPRTVNCCLTIHLESHFLVAALATSPPLPRCARGSVGLASSACEIARFWRRSPPVVVASPGPDHARDEEVAGDLAVPQETL
jgi:hypothetical protein